VEEVPGLTTGVAYSPLLQPEHVGGDFFDLAFLDSRTVMLLLGDVAALGLPSAHVAARVRAGIRLMAQEERSPARLLSRVNHVLARIRSHEELVAAFLFFVDLETLKITMSVAGHVEPVLQSDGRARFIDSVHRSPLGAFYDTTYAEWSQQLRKGDRLVLYTDGITRAGVGDRRFGEDRLLRTISENQAAGEAQLAEAILESAVAFADGRLQDDALVGVVRFG
jgi:sigma-B regulation protein RsbU (phosphoserine phosphatase)